MCDSCDTRVNTTVSVECRWVARVMGGYAGGGYRIYYIIYNERNIQSQTWGIYSRDAWKAIIHELIDIVPVQHIKIEDKKY